LLIITYVDHQKRPLPMNDGLYQILVGILDLFLWGGELIGEENLPRSGPAVFIANHLDATGPIATTCAIPMRVRPWAIANMMDKELAPAWLQWDFLERQLHLKPPLSQWAASALCRIVVPLFYSLGCIPVYRGDYEKMQITLNMSMDVLRQGQFLLIFPEDNRLDLDPVTKMQPFQHSFARLGEMYYEELGKRLNFYPVAIQPSGTVRVGPAIAFDPTNTPGRERRRLKDLLEDNIESMYLHGTGEIESGVLSLDCK
jgi:1-acyl-sn-glycerol-3-phosphate acyltransferase